MMIKRKRRKGKKERTVYLVVLLSHIGFVGSDVAKHPVGEGFGFGGHSLQAASNAEVRMFGMDVAICREVSWTWGREFLVGKLVWVIKPFRFCGLLQAGN